MVTDLNFFFTFFNSWINQINYCLFLFTNIRRQCFLLRLNWLSWKSTRLVTHLFLFVKHAAEKNQWYKRQKKGSGIPIYYFNSKWILFFYTPIHLYIVLVTKGPKNPFKNSLKNVINLSIEFDRVKARKAKTNGCK